MSAMIVQICRADTSHALQPVVGAALQYWAAQGFSKVNVTFVSPGDDMLGVYLKTTTTGAPEQLMVQVAEDFTAVLVMTKPD